jgi:DNA helicase II / ATP-dependent DNA helicase PcrA
MKNSQKVNKYHLRPSQVSIVEYQQGWMGIAAVPGSGKTWTLSFLAADLISRGILEQKQEVLVVTLVNSAVDHFAQKVREFLKDRHILPYGFRIRTLHGLAHDIVRERPSLVGLPNNFIIVDEQESRLILKEAAQMWLDSHPDGLDEWLKEDENEAWRNWVRREKLPELLQDIGGQFIRIAKDNQLTPELIKHHLDELPFGLPLAQMGAAIYEDYQKGLSYRGGVDFDDLIRLAVVALESDNQFLLRLQNRWPYILEDEAQDSNRLQEVILKLLSGMAGNWVRVGDPNQAIYETFTTANPKYLRQFITSPGVRVEALPTSGRSTLSIIKLANELVRWTQNEHPVLEAREALSSPPYILPTEAGDPQPNPDDDIEQIHLVLKKFTAQEEIQVVVESIQKWLVTNKESTVAILVPRNQRGIEVVAALQKQGIDYIELLHSTIQTRKATGALVHILNYLIEPQSASRLAMAYRVWMRDQIVDEGSKSNIERISTKIRQIRRIENFIWPAAGGDWLEQSGIAPISPLLFDHLEAFRKVIQRWQAAIILPADQLLLTIGQDLFRDPADLALCFKLSGLIHTSIRQHPDWRLPEITRELMVIAKNERKFLGFSQDDVGFNPDDYPGKVVVATMHRAKGLEWDRVYLLSVNTYDFPHDPDYGQFIAEKYYLNRSVNLAAETLSQLSSAFSTDEWDYYAPGSATSSARVEYIKERLRLLYVAITRARKELVITWNTGRKGDQQPALGLLNLVSFWEKTNRQFGVNE